MHHDRRRGSGHTKIVWQRSNPRLTRRVTLPEEWEMPGTYVCSFPVNQAANIPHYRIPHYHERYFLDRALSCLYFEPYGNTVDNFRTESILVPMESANSGLSIGTKIISVRKLSVIFVHDPKIFTRIAFFRKILVHDNGVSFGYVIMLYICRLTN